MFDRNLFDRKRLTRRLASVFVTLVSALAAVAAALPETAIQAQRSPEFKQNSKQELKRQFNHQFNPGTIRARIASRTFPSVFQAWNPADNLGDENPWITVARHDLVFHAPDFFGLRWAGNITGISTGFTPESIERALAQRRTLLAKNPNLICLAEIRYRDAHKSYLPANHPWWKRDKNGKREAGWEEGGYYLLDFKNPQFQDQVAKQAQAAVSTGVVDGIMLDWWQDDPDRLQLIQKVRTAIGKDALILVNANDHTTEQTAPYLNGYFMECYRSATAEDWQRIAKTLVWAEAHLRSPRINCLETWYHTSRDDLDLMRATTTLALTRSDGYCLFSDPNPLPTPDHLHNWYPFWDKSLGTPREAGRERPDGSVQREFERGTALYNPMGNAPVTIQFEEPRRSLTTGKVGKEHQVAPGDGDLFLKP